jgi:hypothetical protein
MEKWDLLILLEVIAFATTVFIEIHYLSASADRVMPPGPSIDFWASLIVPIVKC